MKKEYTILIADRNPNVRGLLKRELENEGYLVKMAKNAREVLDWAYRPESVDLLILDPDLPDAEDLALTQKLKDRIPALPTVFHALQLEESKHPGVSNSLMFVEKSGSSIEYMKQLVTDILGKSIPDE